jgi:hypothetical protein
MEAHWPEVSKQQPSDPASIWDSLAMNGFDLQRPMTGHHIRKANIFQETAAHGLTADQYDNVNQRP